MAGLQEPGLFDADAWMAAFTASHVPPAEKDDVEEDEEVEDRVVESSPSPSETSWTSVLAHLGLNVSHFARV
jgi:hypothetical protein